jgi:acyl-coenzyme A thioesterase PaaI-like protein
MDTACGFAAFSVMPPDAAVLTASYTINLMAPAAGERFTITGEVVRAGRTLVVCHDDRRLRQGRHQRLTADER